MQADTATLRAGDVTSIFTRISLHHVGARLRDAGNRVVYAVHVESATNAEGVSFFGVFEVVLNGVGVSGAVGGHAGASKERVYLSDSLMHKFDHLVQNLTIFSQDSLILILCNGVHVLRYLAGVFHVTKKGIGLTHEVVGGVFLRYRLTHIVDKSVFVDGFKELEQLALRIQAANQAMRLSFGGGELEYLNRGELIGSISKSFNGDAVFVNAQQVRTRVSLPGGGNNGGGACRVYRVYDQHVRVNALPESANEVVVIHGEQNVACAQGGEVKVAHDGFILSR